MGHFARDAVALVAVVPAGVGAGVAALSYLGTRPEMADHFVRFLPAFFSGFVLAVRVCEVGDVFAFPHDGLRTLLFVGRWVTTRAEIVRDRVITFCMGMSFPAFSFAAVFFAVVLELTQMRTFNVRVVLVTLFLDLVSTLGKNGVNICVTFDALNRFGTEFVAGVSTIWKHKFFRCFALVVRVHRATIFRA